ncbi:aspartate aminotransferase family protein [Streptomyces scopuliridis]|uniref:4-aminobutyrate aminotransferase n=1 Tax=Streptomyces scopuliridis RB72 TaxID=1440053 RepID=A0A2T7T9I5_9ACTN|nr:aspartate aminotransferase family protein [Streptomyces scopuliridis]PVE11762.1 4-aminobutyrate aminotransferase [Streptomyces scopuliridis RB72]
MVNQFKPSRAGLLDETDRVLLEKRRKVLGDLYPLFYDHPVHIVRAEGSRIYDAQGREYLDVYNNVPSVGHANRRVAEAVFAQMTTMNTHTRYLQDGIVQYSQRFLGTFPGHLDHVIYTNSGSEANDLGIRIAQGAARRTGVIVTRNAYHGTTQLMSGLSPENGSKMPLSPFVRLVDPPDAYRLGAENAAAAFAAEVERAIWDLKRYGMGTAALLIDSIMSTDGIFTDPAGLLDPAFRAVREAGGFVIADEVQPGMGRTGEHMWGFQRHTAEVDMVTGGKPLANGMPMGCLVLGSHLSNAFASENRYFNTFGGNPATIAAADAVLSEIEDRDLVANAARVGGQLLDGLRALAQKFPVIGDVRGAGLFVGVEIVADSVTKEPDGELAHLLVNSLREEGVLISAVGPWGQVLKVRPPLVFTDTDAAAFLRVFEDVLQSVSE